MLDDKVGILDIRAKLNDNIECDIEVQIVNQGNIEKRLLFYWSKLYSSSIRSGDDYAELKKTIVILFADFKIDKLKSINKYHTEWSIREKDFSQIILTDTFEIHIIELSKLKDLLKNKETTTDKLFLWSKFLINPDNMEVSILENNEDIKEAKTELDELRKSEYEQRLADLRLKHILDTNSMKNYAFNEGKKEGIINGKKEEKINLAKKLLAKGISVKEISELTELSVKEIENI